MLKGSPTPSLGRTEAYTLADCPAETTARSWPRLVAGLVALILLIQPACLFRKKKAAIPEAAPAVPSRIVLLPFHLPAENTELRWVALASPILMAKTMEASANLEVVPLWQSMPIAVEAAGATREITPEIAAYVASRLAAKWSTDGELSPANEGISLLLDFIPAKATMVAFRYQKEVRVDSLGTHYYDAVAQFLRYLVARPLGKPDGRLADANSLKELALTLDREYGWFGTADPGKADSVVSNLIRTDPKLARLLFNPGLYPGLGTLPPKPQVIEFKAIPPTPAEKSTPEQPAPPKVQVPPSPAPPENKAEELTVVVPPPKVFSQKMESSTAMPTIDSSTRVSIEPPPPAPSPPEATREAASGAARSDRHAQELPSKPIASIRSSSQASKVVPPTPAIVKPEPSARAVTPPTVSEAPSARTPSGDSPVVKVQVYSLRNKEEAGAQVRRLGKEGVTVEIDEADLGEKGVLYRIRLTGYESRQAAREAAEKLISAGLIQQYWIVR